MEVLLKMTNRMSKKNITSLPMLIKGRTSFILTTPVMRPLSARKTAFY